MEGGGPGDGGGHRGDRGFQGNGGYWAGLGTVGLGRSRGDWGEVGSRRGLRGWQCPIPEHPAPSFGKGCPPFPARPCALGCVPLTLLNPKNSQDTQACAEGEHGTGLWGLQPPLLLGGPQNQHVNPKTSRIFPSQHPHMSLSPQIPDSRMGSAMGHRALLALLLWIPFLMGSAGDGAKDGQEGFRGHTTTSDDLLLRLGRSTWDTLESWVGHQPLQMVAEVGSQFPNLPWSSLWRGTGHFPTPFSPSFPAEPLHHPLDRFLWDLSSPEHTLWDPGGSPGRLQHQR